MTVRSMVLKWSLYKDDTSEGYSHKNDSDRNACSDGVSLEKE